VAPGLFGLVGRTFRRKAQYPYTGLLAREGGSMRSRVAEVLATSFLEGRESRWHADSSWQPLQLF
jgi:hypothetical protein